MSNVKVPDQPFSRIALCCSGGGYRAASFHLGAMAYLYRIQYEGKPLLQNVKALSTVSGGTITGVVYALQVKQGKSFPEIYEFLIKKLSTLDLVRLGLSKLNGGVNWQNPGKRKNLINAFAEIYDKEFTGGETFDIFENMENVHLEEVMFNATEFSSGLIFRFQNDGRFGNYYSPVRRSIGNEVKLSDVIAASSCFTGGFEPIEWPTDFIHEEAIELKDEAQLIKSLGLMDGGIYDNQGIDSILLSETRVDAKPYDLIIVSDVTSPYMHPFQFLPDKSENGWRSWTFNRIRKKINRSYAGLIIVLLMVSISALFYLWFYFENNVLSGILVSAVFLSLLLTILLIWIRSRFIKGTRSAKRYIQKEFSDDIPLESLTTLQFSQIPFHHLESLIVDRVKSLTTLVSEVFLKTVRRLVYGRLYESDHHHFRRASNLIRELTREDFELKRKRNNNDPDYFQNIPGCHPMLQGDYNQVIGAKMEVIAQSAASFGTNLWFTETDKIENRLNDLIICGQASMCFTLLKYIVELRGTPDNGYEDLPIKLRSEIDLVWIQCLADWKCFREEPDFLIKKGLV